MSANTEAEQSHTGVELVQKEPKRKWVSYLWDTFDKPPAERWFLFKLDAALLTFACLGMTFN
jgi:MFS transporter, ACS family, pantothenate transporter